MQPLKNFFISAILLLSVSCANQYTEPADSTEPADQEPSALVNISVSEFTSGFDDDPLEAPTRASSVADYADLKLLTLVFYEGTTPIYECTQNRDDVSTYDTFGNFSCTLPLGDYQLVVVGRTYSTGDTFTLTSATEAAYTSEKVRDTFCAHQPVTVYSTAPQNLNITLSRISSMLRVVSTDNRTTEATQIRTTFGAGGKGFNPTTGLATTNTGFTVINHLTSAVGNPIAIYSYLYLSSDTQTMDITLEVLDDNNQVLYTKVVPNVTLQRNRRTKLTGPLFNPSSLASTTIQIESSWLPESTVNF